MALPRLQTDYDELNPYDVASAEDDVRRQNLALSGDKNKLATALKKINQRKVILEYYNSTAVKEALLAPTLRAEYRYLTKPEKIAIPTPVRGLNLEPWFMPGAIIPRDAGVMWQQAAARFAGQKSSGRIEDRVSFEDYVTSNTYEQYALFCMTPITEYKRVRRGGRYEKVVKGGRIATFKGGPVNTPYRKFYNVPFGWVVFTLAHPHLPACSPLYYTINERHMGWFADDADPFGAPCQVTLDEEERVSVSAYAPYNLKLCASASGVAYERLYHMGDEFEGYRMKGSVRQKLHPYDQGRHAQIVRELGVDFLDPDVKPADYENLALRMEND